MYTPRSHLALFTQLIMVSSNALPPLSLYVHLPWCVRKCPYCDFNSHALLKALPEKEYVQALLAELEIYLDFIQKRPLISIFFGGGTPSLFSAQAIHDILTGIAKHFVFSISIEISLEANPGTVDQSRFKDLYQAGVNRLSLGIQSFQADKLKLLNRIHNDDEAKCAVEAVKQAGFNNFNIDLMYGLPTQTVSDALFDLQTAISFTPSHLSWYQLTLEPNTLFHQQPPASLPNEDELWEMQKIGQAYIKKQGFNQYEVSAYCLPNKACEHNRNYWEYGDYLGIGAGAHSKITQHHQVIRFSQIKHPRDYLQSAKRRLSAQTMSEQDIAFEFMLNALRLNQNIPFALFEARTGLAIEFIKENLNIARQKGLLQYDLLSFSTTALGKQFLNDLIALFLPHR